MIKAKYTQEDINNYLGYMKDVNDLMEFENKKISVYESTCNKMISRFDKYRKIDKPTSTDKTELDKDISIIWSDSKVKIKDIIRNKPVKAGASVDNFLDAKDKIGKKNDFVKKDEAEFKKTLNKWRDTFDNYYYNWNAGGDNRRKMFKNWSNKIINDTKIRPSYRKMDYVADTIFFISRDMLGYISSMLKALN